jgi:hypothetical protein
VSHGLVALACAGLLAGAGDPVVSGEGKPAPRRLTPKDDGGVFTMRVGQTAGLVVPDPNAPDPEVEGGSVEVVAVVNVDGSGRREWELRAVAVGRTTLRAGGTHGYALTLDVRPRADPDGR